MTNFNNNIDYDNNSNCGCAPDMDKNTCHTPMGVPMMPLYGYDNCEDADKDWNYMRQMYPLLAKKILVEVEDECDKLEYDGSCMFDEYPDRVYLDRIVERIYFKVKDLNNDNLLKPESIDFSAKDQDNDDKNSSVQTNQYRRPDRDDRRDRQSDNRLRDLIEVLLFNELLNRRRRYRGRRRWF